MGEAELLCAYSRVPLEFRHCSVNPLKKQKLSHLQQRTEESWWDLGYNCVVQITRKWFVPLTDVSPVKPPSYVQHCEIPVTTGLRYFLWNLNLMFKICSNTELVCPLFSARQGGFSHWHKSQSSCSSSVVRVISSSSAITEGYLQPQMLHLAWFEASSCFFFLRCLP